MLELADELLPLLRADAAVAAVAAVTVTSVARSAPRGAGATMAVTADGRVIGSISGGCVEGDAIALAYSVLAGAPSAQARFGFDDDTAHAAGLACGGSVEVIAYRVRPDDPVARAALEAVEGGRGVTVGVVLAGESAGQVLGGASLQEALHDPDGTIAHAIAWRETLVARTRDGAPVLVMSAAPRPVLIILGAGEHAAALCRVGAAAGFAVTVCDPWETLVTRDRFPAAARTVTALPHEFLRRLDASELDARAAVCVLTHDERLDIPAIEAALTLPVGFVGAMGARSSVARRLALLREAGVPEIDLARLHSPLGLDLGGSSPDETAVSVLAEIVSSRHGGSGAPLREGTGALHRTTHAELDAARPVSCAVSPSRTASTGARS